MRYLVNKYTKEHIVWPDTVPKTGADWHIVEADSEGWIANTGNKCPLPYNHLHEVKDRDGDVRRSDEPQLWDWYKDGTPSDITHYRPILEPEKVQEPEPIPAPQYDPRSVSFNLLDRLKAAHAHAQQIPDLEAKLREALGSMGYDLVARSPFVEPEAAVEPDMSDWRNWREGDLVLCVDGSGCLAFSTGMVCYVTGHFVNGIEIDKIQVGWSYTDSFRFHSRPSKGE